MSDIETFLTKYKLNLTEQQKTAVSSIDGPVLLLAVPGSGKTTTLVARLGYMLFEKNIAPENILILTYTVAATKDMSQRFESVFGDDFKERLEFRTINGVCAKIILYYSRRIRREAFGLEADEKRRNARISSVFQKVCRKYPSESEIKEISTAFTYIKNMMLSDEEIKKKASEYDYKLEEIYREYNQSLVKDGMMDYDDQMRYALNILKSSPETLSYFQNIYKYICVDEAQDTSKIQHFIIALLSAGNDNLFMVGDEDQSIYGFRAAYPQALLDFEKNHAGAKILVMEKNFRSNSCIVDSANRFIQKNCFRHKKTMTAFREPGADIKLKKLQSRAEQYDYLIKKLENVKTETAVLYRNNDSVIPLVDRLERKGIRYRIKNAEPVFFSHRIVMDILDIMKFAENPDDSSLFLKIYFKMNTFLSKKEAEHICEVSRKKKMNVLKTLSFITFDNAYKTSLVKDFVIDMEQLSTIKKPANVINYIVNVSGYREYLKKNKLTDSKSFILVQIAKYCDSTSDLFRRLEFLKSLLTNEKYSGKADVILSTIHSSKGLEYDTVYMLDIMDTVLPETVADITSSKEERYAYEEERRIYYVGITRAKERLILIDCGEKSSFVDETVRTFKPSSDMGISFKRHIK